MILSTLSDYYPSHANIARATKASTVRQLLKFFGILMALIVALSATLALAEEPVSPDEEPESDQSDIYYNAMIRSIDLDKNRWKPFSRSMGSGPWFYDTQSIKRNGRKVSVMVTVFPHPQKTAAYSGVYSDHPNIRKIIFETEINCAARSYRQPLIRVYGYYKELLTEHIHTDRNFSSIRQGTTTDTLRSLICAPAKKKKEL
jgi:hypothetical protein